MRFRIVAVGLMSVISGLCSAQSKTGDRAKIPYVAVYQRVSQVELASADFVDSKDRAVQFVLLSKLPDVEAQDITAYIDSKSGKISLELNPDGTFLLPLSAGLMKENPFIVTNQPIGSMELYVALESKVASGEQIVDGQNKLRYRNLFVVETLVEKVTAALDGPETKPLGTNWWCHFEQEQPTTAPALIHCADGDVEVKPGPDGIIRLRYNPQLAKENPWVTFPSKGSWRLQANDLTARTH